MEKQIQALGRHHGVVQAEKKKTGKDEHAESSHNVIVHLPIPPQRARRYRRRTHHRNPARAKIAPMAAGPGADPMTNHHMKRAHATAEAANIAGPASGSLRGFVRSLFILEVFPGDGT